MKQISDTENPLVLRTDFNHQAAWDHIRAVIQRPVGLFRFRAHVEFLENRDLENISKDQLLALIPANYSHNFIMIADTQSMTGPDYPLLIVDLYELSGNTFRALPSQIQSIENNLSLANMDFEEFAASVDGSGVFRGFPQI